MKKTKMFRGKAGRTDRSAIPLNARTETCAESNRVVTGPSDWSYPDRSGVGNIRGRISSGDCSGSVRSAVNWCR